MMNGQMTISQSKQQGFGLLELVVVLMIGSMIVLLAVMMFGAGIKQLNDAHNSASLIDADMHGVQALSKQLRMAGFGMYNTIPSALIIHPQQVAHLRHQAGGIPNTLLSQHGVQVSGAGVAMASDQLTIWYVAPMDMWDCEGNLALGARRARLKGNQMATVTGQVVIERYFVQAEEDGSLSLRCDAARYVTDDIQRDGTRDRRGLSSAFTTAIIDAQVGKSGVSTANTVQGLGGAGEVMIADIDGFWVRLNTAHQSGIRQLSIREYQSATAFPQVVGIELAILVKAPIVMQTDVQLFKLFGKAISIADNRPRRLYQLTVPLPNATADQLPSITAEQVQ